MPFRIAQLPCDNKFSPHFSVALLERIYPRDLVCDLLTQFHLWEERERKLNQLVMVYLLIAWHLFLNESVRSVFLRLSAGLRLVGHMSMSQVPTKGPFSIVASNWGFVSCARSCVGFASRSPPHTRQALLPLATGWSPLMAPWKMWPIARPMLGSLVASLLARPRVPSPRLAVSTWSKPPPISSSTPLWLPVRPANSVSVGDSCAASPRACLSCWIVALFREPSWKPFSSVGRSCWHAWLQTSSSPVRRSWVMAATSRPCPLVPARDCTTL